MMWLRICLLHLGLVTATCALLWKSEKMRATSDGVCMYQLPAKFNVDLTNSSFNAPVPQSVKIPSELRAFFGLYDTDQFSLDRVFYDRMQQEATTWLQPEECKLFYVPYFSQWETCFRGKWNAVDRSHLDTELLSHLNHMGRFRKPSGVDHFLTLSRVERDSSLLKNPSFAEMKKLTIEAKAHGGQPNVHAVPYPAWFRYSPDLEPEAGKMLPNVVVSSASFGHLTSATVDAQCFQVSASELVREACSKKPSCSFRVPATIKGCTIGELHGQYRCSDSSKQASFHAVSGRNGGQAVVLACAQGPCWLWGNCHKPVGEARMGPLAAFIGHAKPHETVRLHFIEQCKQRPELCVFVHTGVRGFKLHSDVIVDLQELLMSSVFCINPPGDTPTRKGLFDSLLAGCIPVISDEASLSMYKWYLKDWRLVSVLIPSTQMMSSGFNMVDHLASLSASEVQQKQDAIRQVAFSLQYSKKPKSGDQGHLDAFDVAIRSLSL